MTNPDPVRKDGSSEPSEAEPETPLAEDRPTVEEHRSGADDHPLEGGQTEAVDERQDQ